MGLLKAKPEEVEVFAIARNIEDFPALIEDLDAELSGRWSALPLKNGEAAIKAGVGSDLEIAIVAVSHEDESNLTEAERVVQVARDHGLKVLLVAKDVSPKALHHLLRVGADDFAPYPMDEGALSDSIASMRSTLREPAAEIAGKGGQRKRHGLVIPIYGIAGGVGASTFAVNLAWELALLTKKTDKRVCILDFNFQFGSVATYLDLARREAIYELISDP
ncbi:MAG: pilus assembly protein CpaE, partial [Desulfuromonadales bacterium]|nr:pilus assembly protein CpaE [Desulfuromonadales bacterium]